MNISLEKEKAKKLRQSQWWNNLISSQPKCYYCSQVLERSNVTMDHIVPLSRGGKSSRGNIVPCCKSCNNNKKYMTATEFILSQNL